LEKYFKNSGLRMSKQRRAVIGFFRENNRGHFSLNEIYEKISETDKDISFTTVYRTCKLLEDLGLIRRISFEERHIHYESNLTPHIHYQCIICGKVIEEEKCLGNWEDQLKNKDFLLTSYRIQVYGICKDCQKRHPEELEKRRKER